MAEIVSLTTLPWADGGSILSDAVRLVWADGTALYSTGGTYTAPSPPGGGTPAVPNLTARTAIAAAAAYDLVPICTVVDLRDGLPVECDSVSFNTDEDALFWAVSLSGGQSLYDKLKAGTQPATVAVTLNGEEWRFVIEDVPRQRRHGEATVRASGRSLTCLAGAPYEFEQNWSLAGDTTALQLAAAANANTGLTVEWGLVDWPIPDGVFSHTGTPLSVVKRVADAVGAMIQSDPKDFLVRVLPRYDLLPNEWPTVAPDAELAEAALEVEGYENTNTPAYDGVYVLGQQGGAAAFVRLAGTSGANLKPMVTDALLTDLAACSQRGMAELGRSGEQQRHTLTLPVFSAAGQPGVLAVGRLVKVMEAVPWWGVVRSVSVQAQFGDASQTVTVERHTRAVDGTYYDPNAPTPLRFVGAVPAQTMTPGVAFLLDLSAYFVDGVPPYGFTMRSGVLPSWLTLDPDTGHLTGTVPGSMAPVTLRFRCTDAVSSTADTNEAVFSVSAGEGAAVRLAVSGTEYPYASQAASVNSTWVDSSGGGAFSPLGLAYNGSHLLSVGSDGIYYSTDAGDTWTEGTFRRVEFSPVWTGSAWIAPLNNNTVNVRTLTSSDGETWAVNTLSSTPTGYDTAYSAAYAAGTVVAACGYRVLKSSDGGIGWTSVLTGGTGQFKTALAGGGNWVIVEHSANSVSRSTDATSWISQATPLANKGPGAYGGGRFVLLATSNTQAQVTDDGGATWAVSTLPTSITGAGFVPRDITYDGGQFVVLFTDGSNNSKIAVSVTGAGWTAKNGPAGLNANLIVGTP